MTRPLALVTGGCRRLGAHIAARLASDGYDIALHAGHDPALETWLGAKLADVIHAVFVADLSDSRAVAALPGRVTDHFGRPIDLLVNSASRFSALDDGDDQDEIDRHMRVNLSAPVVLARAVARAGAQAVVNIVDQRIANPPRDQLAYTLSKQALGEATRTLAVALAPHTRVNAVAPGLTLPTAEYAEGQLECIAAMMPLERLPAPEHIADAVAWLGTAKSITGQVVFVDGGAHLKGFERDFVHLGR